MAKRALCIGVSYDEAFANFPDYQLHSALDDVDKFKDLLTTRFEYAEEDITVLKDDGSNTDPTYDNMLEAMSDLVSSASEGDHLVFYFAGHGTQDPEGAGVHNEEDGLDEAILPSDVEPLQDSDDGLITSFKNHMPDDIIRENLVNPALARGAYLVVIFDCCHSGTAADLDDPTQVQPHAKTRTKPFRLGTWSDPDLKAVSWAACQDPQIALGGPASGLFTDALVDVLNESDNSLTHQEGVDRVREKMGETLADRLAQQEGLSAKKKARLTQYYEQNCTPQVQFLNDDSSLFNFPVESTLMDEQ